MLGISALWEKVGIFCPKSVQLMAKVDVICDTVMSYSIYRTVRAVV